jgi:F-type H+-transporting ATPase subunit c
MTLFSRLLLVLLVLFLSASPSFAGDIGAVAGVGMGLAVLGAGLGIGLVAFAALTSIARQPEMAGKITGPMFILAFLVEGAAIVALILCFVIGNK